MSESTLQSTTAATSLSGPFLEEGDKATTGQHESAAMEVNEETKSSNSNSSSSSKMSSSHNNCHKNGDICWVGVLRDEVLLVETTGIHAAVGGGHKDREEKHEKDENNKEKSALDVAIAELLGQPVNLGWQFYSPWQGEYKGIKFLVYDDDNGHKFNHNTAKEGVGDDDDSDDEKVTVWTFGCIYYTGISTTAAEGSTATTNTNTTTSVVHRPRLQAFLEKIMLLTEPLRQADDMWRRGERYACQDIYSDMIWQRLQEEQLEYHVGGPTAAAVIQLDLDYSRQLTEVNRQVVNRHNQRMAQKDEVKRRKELALLQQMQELNQRLEQEQSNSSNNNSSNSNSKKWWQSSMTLSSSSSLPPPLSSSSSSSLQNVTGGSRVAQQLLAAASRQIFSSSFSSSSTDASLSSSSINSVDGSGGGNGESMETVVVVENNEQQQQQVQQGGGGLLLPEHNHHHHYDDDVHSVESINAMSDVSSVCVEDILSQLEREVTFRNVHAHVLQQHTAAAQQEQEEATTTMMRDQQHHHRHSEEEKKEMDHDEDGWNESPQSQQGNSKSLDNHHTEPPKSPSSTMAAVVLGV